jgi:signal transduction histidine kinase
MNIGESPYLKDEGKMMSDLRKMPELAALLQDHEDEIVGAWAKKVHSIPSSLYQQYPLEEITQWTVQGMAAIIESFGLGIFQVLEEYLNGIVYTRLLEGFTIYEVAEGLLLAKEVILPIILGFYSTDLQKATEAINQLDICLRYMVGYFGNIFSESLHNQLTNESHQRLVERESIQRTLAAMLQKLNLDEVLEIVCSEARKLTKAAGSAVLLLEDEWLRVTFSNGNPLPAVDRITVVDSLAGLSMEQGKPFLANGPSNQVQAYHRNPDLRSLLVVPLFAEGISIGVIDVVNKPDGFTKDDTRIMELFADQAAIAIENARLHQQAEQLAVVKERERIARDLHDSVTQTLYSLSLFIDATQKALQGDKTKKAKKHVHELRKLAREAMLDMRLLIFELHPPILQKEGLAVALRTRLEAVESRSGIRTEYQVVSERRLPLEIEAELYHIAQEALTNVVKHSQAESVNVTLYYGKNRFKMKVQDNGMGFDIGKVDEGGGMGIRGIKERVQRMNGKLYVESVLNRGTIIVVTVKI